VPTGRKFIADEADMVADALAAGRGEDGVQQSGEAGFQILAAQGDEAAGPLLAAG
jgi:hypothetical protein